MSDIASVTAAWNAAYTATQAITAAPPPPPPPVLAIGARCKATKNPTAVRTIPRLSGTLLTSQPINSLGTIVADTTYTTQPVSQDGGLWWKVDFDTGSDGWVWGANLVAI